jgi:cytochrome P450
MSQTTHPILEDYTDKNFDPYVTFDRMSGAEDVTDIWPRLHELEGNGAVQKGDARAAFGVPPFPFWTHLPSYMLFGYDNVSKAFFDGATFSSTIMMSIYTGTFGASINGMDAPEHMRYRRLFQRAFLPGTVAKWGAELVPKVVDRLIDRFIHKGNAELVQDFTIHYPCVGIDPEHAMEGSRKLGVYLEALLKARGEAGTDDLIGMLARARWRTKNCLPKSRSRSSAS